jgi:hexosaminidase
MISIIISPKFNKENILSIHLENKDKKDFKNIKICFSLVYSVKSLKGASIIKQVGRYYELKLKNKDLLLNEKYKINIELQTPRIGTYNLSCGPEGLFVLDENDNLIQSELETLIFDRPIKKKFYEEINSEIINPIIPEPLKINLSSNFLENSDKNFFSKNKELQNICHSLKSTTKKLGFDFNSNKGIEIKYSKVKMLEDEYKIIINSQNVIVYSSGYGGSFYALVSILQLAYYYLGNLPIGKIEDKPKFSWRGMHLDCSRQFHSIDRIKRLLIYMSLFKLNRFHWHLTDNEAWRLDLESFPNLAKKTSFRGYKQVIPPFYGSGYQKSGGYYLKEDVKKLIIFAKNLNIEIMPEIDLPAHSWALLQIIPELYDCSSNIESQDVGNYKNNTINPALTSTWNFIKKIIKEISDLFSYDIIHVGMDERPKLAWQGSQKITKMMKEKNLLSHEEVQDFYMNKLINLIKVENKISAAWNEAVISPHTDNGSGGGKGNIDKNCLIFAWEHPDVALQLVKKGFHTVLCPGQKTYFDMAYNNSTEERGICWASTIEVEDVHSWKPLENIDNNFHYLILGIQGQLWSETLTEKSYLDQMINPRLATLAEVAWSSDKRRGWSDFKLSLKNSMKLLKKIGWNYHDF